jgi:hypothetical protein
LLIFRPRTPRMFPHSRTPPLIRISFLNAPFSLLWTKRII